MRRLINFVLLQISPRFFAYCEVTALAMLQQDRFPYHILSNLYHLGISRNLVQQDALQ